MKAILKKSVADGSSNLRSISEFFDHHGERWISVYDQERQERWYEYYPIRIRERYACALIRDEAKGTALDLGCGGGHALLEMRRMGFARVVGVDISDNMLECARRLVTKHAANNGIEVHRCDVQNLTVVDTDSTDVCTALGVIEYLPSDGPMLREVHRILRPGGVFVVQVRNRYCYKSVLANILRMIVPPLRSKIWYREHNPAAFRATLRQNGFTVEEYRFAHYYALFPFSYTPGTKILIRWLDNFLNRQLEGLSTSWISVPLASMFIVRARKT